MSYFVRIVTFATKETYITSEGVISTSNLFSYRLLVLENFIMSYQGPREMDGVFSFNDSNTNYNL